MSAFAEPGGAANVLDRSVLARGPVPAVAVLAPVDPAALSAAGRIDALIALEALKGWADAQQQRLFAAMAPPGDPHPAAGMAGQGVTKPGFDEREWIREEIACALRLPPGAVNARLHVARELVTRLPDTLTLLQDGAVTLRHAALLAEAVVPLDDAACATVQTRVLLRAAEQTTAQFRRSVTRAVIAADPRTAEQRHAAAVTDRRVALRILDDAMAELRAVLPAEDAMLLMTRIDTDAVRRDPDDDRSIDQRRADALTALAHTATTAGPSGAQTWQGRRPAIHVCVALSTLLGLDEQPGELEGYGPIPAGLTRRLAADPTGTWRRLITDPRGQLLDYGRNTYRPPRDLADHVIARDRTSRFPGSSTPARRCELDHQTPWAHGGTTSADNLQALGARQHHLKDTAPGWRVTGNPDGPITWTTPTGHTYLTRPGRYPLDTTIDTDRAAVGPDPPPPF